jgi:hypothetical protein
MALTCIFGVTLTKEPCKLCIQKSGFCHYHKEQQQQQQQQQQGRGTIVLSDPIKRLLVKKMQVGKECKIYGITKAHEPCKRCIRQGLFCHQHSAAQSSRGAIDLAKFVDTSKISPLVCGKKVDGSVCKNCLCHETGFCHQHWSQEEALVADAVASSDLTKSPPNAPTSSWTRLFLRGTFMLLLIVLLSKTAMHARDTVPVPRSQYIAPPLSESQVDVVASPPPQTSHVAETLEDTRVYLMNQFSALAQEVEDRARVGVECATEIARDAEEKAREGVNYLSGLVGEHAQSLRAQVRNSTVLALLEGTDLEGAWKELIGQREVDGGAGDRRDMTMDREHEFVSTNETNYETVLWKYISGSFLAGFQASEI